MEHTSFYSFTPQLSFIFCESSYVVSSMFCPLIWQSYLWAMNLEHQQFHLRSKRLCTWWIVMSHQILTFSLAAWVLNVFLLLMLEYVHLAPGPSRGGIAVLMGMEQQGQKASFFAGVYHPAALLQSVTNSNAESTFVLTSACACHANQHIHLCMHGKMRLDQVSLRVKLPILDDTMQACVYGVKDRVKCNMRGRGN